MWINAIDPRILTLVLLMVSAVGLYAACRVAMRAVIASDASYPGRRAFCQWLPISATAIAAVLMHHPEVAIAVIFGSSVALMSLVLGMTTYVAPLNPQIPRSRVWAFALAPSLLALMAGFSGVVSALSAAMLLVLGGTIFAVWHEDASTGSLAAVRRDPSVIAGALGWSSWAQLSAAVILASIAGKAMVGAAIAASRQAQIPSETLVALSAIAPILTLPSLRSCVTVAERGDTHGAISAIVGTVLLNLCVLLPIVAFLGSHAGVTHLDSAAGASPLTAFFSAASQGLPYPGGIWRVETVALVVLGFAMVPIALGRMTLTRVESSLLVAGYALYLAAVAWSSKRG